MKNKLIRYIFLKLIFLFCLSSFSSIYAQSDSVWNIFVLKKGCKPELYNDMSIYRKSGFYLYRNCFYNIVDTNSKKWTLKLILVCENRAIFTTISNKTDNPSIIERVDTVVFAPNEIECLRIPRQVNSNLYKRINSKHYHFIFCKSFDEFNIKHEYAKIFGDDSSKTELIPILTTKGILYCFEYNHKLIYHSIAEVKKVDYNTEQKKKITNGIIKALDILINRRIVIKLN